MVRRQGVKKDTPQGPVCPSCRSQLTRVNSGECIGRIAYTDLDGEDRVALLMDPSELEYGCPQCSTLLPGGGLVGAGGGRFRLLIGDESFDGVDLFDSRDVMANHLFDQTGDEVDLDYEMVLVEASFSLSANAGWLDVVCDERTVDEALQVA